MKLSDLWVCPPLLRISLVALCIGLTSLRSGHAEEAGGTVAGGAAVPSQRAVNFPQFSWDRIPRYMHVRKARSFTDDEIQYLSKFPLITFEKANGHLDHGSVEAGTLAAARALKAINPKATILYYRNVMVHYGGYEADEQLGRISGAFLRGRTGHTKLVRGRVEAYDLSNAELRSWWANACRTMTQSPDIDGVFLDGNVKAIEPAYLAKEIGLAKKQQTIEGYHELIRETRQAIGPGELMLANLLRARFEDAGLEYLDYFDGSYLENFFHNVGDADYEQYVARGIDAFQTAARQGKIIAFTCGLASTNRKSTGSNDLGIDEAHASVETMDQARQGLMYPLAVFLVCAERYSYFRVHEGYSANESDRWMRWFPEYDRPLGPPDGPASREGSVYRRKFRHASVMVDIRNRTADIRWTNPSGEQ
ncbi:putative glycoside hydrolase [Crateriforma conspicua]|uniref:Uncharacterized protein n=1 Tax=Crateriforma conspicua TaxID=2527996 RepID=A0A5C6FNG3_9PLAN|nr:putative glycoside hydrolase [Crateriforma conspicua]TWU64677.1 hypothetical protein V7x_02210 [Crateriforma conspicua]